ncbi:MAG: hypothetical protein QOH56_1767 [Pseudonocardiales bacterium]|jgi:hypothetical protein|nr:hypothetical protein [Frankiales bacterium]MDQ1690522.1 hypothetical protein [Pseudonocardiales bacterium]MDQ1735516.1 hypothetical protein [Pseudonocardiales bacterium]MDQ1750791.1 hypothetical protein [Pseudonocardiales bacterium]
MFIRTVDDGLERLLRASLPLPEEIGDVAFDAPTSNWSAQLSRITVNLFLYDVSRSTQPTRSATQRIDSNGRSLRRAPQPMIQLGYLVSAWAGSPRDEHQLLGDLVSRLAAVQALPPELLPSAVTSTVHLDLAEDPLNRLRDIWSGAGGQLKASFTLQVTVAADSFDWQDQAPSVTRIEALTLPKPIVRG